jgi:hypothetical protein
MASPSSPSGRGGTYYVIDAVRWSHEGRLSHVLWHPVSLRGETIEHGRGELVPVIDAGRACDESEIRVYVDGPVGSYFKMKACAEGIEAETEAGAPLRERLAHLPAV